MARNFASNSDYVKVTATIGNPASTGFSLACWFYWPAVQNTQAILADYSGGNEGYRLKFSGANKLALDTFGSYPSNETGGATVPSTNTWHHAAGTWSSTAGGTLYLDGASDGSNATQSAPGTLTSPALYVSNYNLLNAGFVGRIGEVAIWSRVLTAHEVAALAKGASPAVAAPNGLIGYWPLHGVSTTEPDLSGSRNSGAVTGTTVVAPPPVRRLAPAPDASYWGVPSATNDVNVSDSFTASESAVVTATIPASDAGTESETSNLNGGQSLSETDSGTSSESASITASSAASDSAAVAENGVVLVNAGGDTWPIAKTPSMNNWSDHFAGSSLGSRWATIISNGGSITVANSYVDMNCSTASQTASAYLSTKLDLTKRFTITFAFSFLNGSGPSDIIKLVSGAWTPSAQSYSSYNPYERFTYAIANGSSTLCHTVRYYNTSHVQQYWDGSANTFTSTSTVNASAAGGNLQTNDYYVAMLIVDGPNGRFRWDGYGLAFATAGTYTANQGFRQFVQTDWISFSSLEDTSQGLWLVLGNPVNTNGLPNDFRYEWVDYAEAPGNVWYEAYAARKSSVSTGHDACHYKSADGYRFFLQDRTTKAIARGATYDSGECQEPCARNDGQGTDHLWYMASNSSTGVQTIAHATAPHATPQDGTWTKDAANPILSPSATGTAQDDKQLSEPFVIIDETTQKTYLFYSGQSSVDLKWRTFLATASTPGGTFTKQGLVIDVGASGDIDNKWARRPVVLHYAGQWMMFYEAKDASSVDHMGVAKASSLGGTWAKLGTSQMDPVPNGNTTLTGTLNTAPGRTWSVGSSAGFSQDSVIVAANSTNLDQFILDKVRQVVDGQTIETYFGATGMGASPQAYVIGTANSPTWNVQQMIQSGNTWIVYTVPWEPFSDTAESASAAALYEGCHVSVLASVSPLGGTPAYNEFVNPAIPHDYWSGMESVENMTLTLEPFTSGPPVIAYDAFLAIETATVTVTASASDATSVSENGSVNSGGSFSGADSATATEAVALTATLPYADAATAADTPTLTASTTFPIDAGVVSESASVTQSQSFSQADAGAAGELGVVTASSAASDAGAGSESSILTSNASDAFTATETTTLNETLVYADGGAANEQPTVTASLPVSDAASAADSAQLFTGQLQTGSDSGAIGEAAVLLVATMIGADAGAVSEAQTLTATVPAPDAGAAGESPAVAAALAAQDAASAADSGAITGPGQQNGADSGSAAEGALLSATVPGADSAAASESASLSTGQLKNGTDAAAIVEQAILTVQLTVLDQSVLVEGTTITASLAAADAWSAAESTTLAQGRLLAGVDSASVSETSAPSAFLSPSEGGAISETFSIVGSNSASEHIYAGDFASLAALLLGPDSGVGVDSAVTSVATPSAATYLWRTLPSTLFIVWSVDSEGNMADNTLANPTYQVGQTVTFYAETKLADLYGNQTDGDAGNVQFILTDPTGVVTTVGATHDATGRYHCAFQPNVVGRWKAQWTGTLPAPGGTTFHFDVYDPGA